MDFADRIAVRILAAVPGSSFVMPRRSWWAAFFVRRALKVLLYGLIAFAAIWIGDSRADQVGNTMVEVGTRSLNPCFVGMEIVLPVEAESLSVWAYLGQEDPFGALAWGYILDAPESFVASSGGMFIQPTGVLDWQQFPLTAWGPPTFQPGTYIIAVTGEGTGGNETSVASADYSGSGAGRTSESGCGIGTGGANPALSLTDVDLRPSIYLEYTEVVPEPPVEGGNGIEGWFLLGAAILAFSILFSVDA